MTYSFCVRDLYVQRGYLILIEKISFSLNKGDVLYIKGSNGIGKSSLLLTLVGLLPHFRGSITFDQTPLKHEDFNWFNVRSCMKDDLTVYQNLRMWADLENQADTKIFSAFKVLEIDFIKDNFFRTLSKGQQQRVSLSRLFLNSKPLWILDEPFIHLDAQSSLLLVKAIENYLAQGGIIIFTSQQPISLAKMKTLNVHDYRPAKRVGL